MSPERSSSILPPSRRAAYDARDRTVELMLGEHAEPMRHLTDGVTRVRTVEVVAEFARRDRPPLIERADGDALLTFAG